MAVQPTVVGRPFHKAYRLFVFTICPSCVDVQFVSEFGCNLDVSGGGDRCLVASQPTVVVGRQLSS